MAGQTHEQTINIALGEVLSQLGHDWDIRAEQVGGVLSDGGRPDVLVEKPGEWPVVIEAEVEDYSQAEQEARERIGKELSESGQSVDLAVALVYPAALRNLSGPDLRQRLHETTFEYAVLSKTDQGGISRFPLEGWLSGSIRDLALLLHLIGVPASRVDELADVLEEGVSHAEHAFSQSHPQGSQLGKSLAGILGQNDDSDGQTRKMAMTVIADALIFHASLAEEEVEVIDHETGEPRPVYPVRRFRTNGEFLPTPLTEEWNVILEVNYWPIFHSAGALLHELPTKTAAQILDILWDTAERMIAGGVTKSHDLTGMVFQRLIADRKFLATFYTQPSAASLLATLALPLHLRLRGASWDDADSLASLRIGDFACGTGTLLSTAYRRISLLHELHGGDPKLLHPQLMKNGLVGMDVLNIAVHLTAAMLAGTNPDTPFEGECLLTVPYGIQEWGTPIGSLSLLTQQLPFEFMKSAARTAGGKGEEHVNDLLERVRHGQFDLIIMNPPFSRHGAREGERLGIHNPAFAAFEADEQEQQELANELKRVGEGGCGHGHAGVASYFVDLVYRKLSENGRAALILPLSAMSGSSWEKVRNTLRDRFSDIRIVTIAGSRSQSRSFSSDTHIAECLVVATKSDPEGEDRRGIFCVLRDQPKTSLSGELIGHLINTTIHNGSIRKLESGPVGGTPIRVGEKVDGELVSCPLPETSSWSLVGIKHVDVAQTAYQLVQGKLWIEGMDIEDVEDLPIARIRNTCERVGSHHLDIGGSAIKEDGLPQGPFEKYDGMVAGASYPCLWNHSASRERQLIVQPDSHCRIRDVQGDIPVALRKRAARRWETASRIHYNLDLQFNSQSLVVAVTERPSLGGRAWPTVVLEQEYEPAFALWSNSTLGLLCHWWDASKTQNGRGTTSVSRVPQIVTLDLNMLSSSQHEKAKSIFEDLKYKRLLPFDQIDEDGVRHELDRRFLVEVLNLPPSICEANGPIDRLRQKLAAEPQIHGGKQTRLVFTEEGEKNVRRQSFAGA